MNINTLKTYAHSLHQMAGMIQAEEFTSSKAWYLYRCKLVEFLFEFKTHFVQKELKQVLENLGYYPVSHWAAKFGISRAFMYKEILQDGHVIEFEKRVKYVAFEIGYAYARKKRGRPKKFQFDEHQ